MGMDIVFLLLAYGMYRWGRHNGVKEGRMEAWRDDQLMRLEEFMDEAKSKS